MRWLIWICTCVSACSGSGEDSGVDTVCDETVGTVWGELVDFDGNLHGGNTVVYVYADGETDGVALPATAEGSYEVELAPGLYRFGAESDWGCFADPEPEVDVEACGRHRADLVMDLCYGR